MNVVIVGNFWFPHGTASAARVRNLAQGFGECGARVHVITLAPPARLDGSASEAGALEYEGVSYEHVAPCAATAVGWRDPERTIPRLRNRPADRVRWFAGLYAATAFARRRLRERMDRGECDLVVVYDRSLLRMAPLAGLCRARGVTSVLDVVEVPEQVKGGRLNALYWDIALGTRASPRLFDGLTVITAGLEALYRTRGYSNLLLVPSIEEWPLASVPEPTGNPEFRLTYVGALQSRDAPDLLLEAVRILSLRGLPVVLDLVGHYEGTARGQEFLHRCAADADLGRSVRFLGSLSDAALVEHLRTSDGLLLTRRKAATEELSFPTRLVEYLRVGRPVFVSDVGDVARYLRDGDEAALLHPTDPGRIAEDIARVVSRPDRGAEIGRRGREAGARAFDRKTHAGRILDFAAGLRRRAA